MKSKKRLLAFILTLALTISSFGQSSLATTEVKAGIIDVTVVVDQTLEKQSNLVVEQMLVSQEIQLVVGSIPEFVPVTGLYLKSGINVEVFNAALLPTLSEADKWTSYPFPADKLIMSVVRDDNTIVSGYNPLSSGSAFFNYYRTSTQTIQRLSGYMHLTAGVHYFKVTCDDGVSFKVGNQNAALVNLASDPTNSWSEHSSKTYTFVMTASETGDYPYEIKYFDYGGDGQFVITEGSTATNTTTVSNKGIFKVIDDQPLSISVSPTDVTLEVGTAAINRTTQLVATVLPSSTIQTVTWTSNNPSIAEVSSTGLVTAKAIGNAVITVTSINGKKASSNIAVIQRNNTAPIAINDSYTVDEDSVLNVSTNGALSNDTDAESDALTAVKVSDPSQGSVIFNANGTFTYTPDGNFYGSDSFTYKANDGREDSNVGTVTISVNNVNDAPIAVADSAQVTEDVASDIAVKANDTDVDGNPLTVKIVTGPLYGTVTINADGTVRYTPASNYNGPDSFTYAVNDGTVDSAPATVSITVSAADDVPRAINDSTSTVTPNAVTIDVLSNDTDVDSTALSIKSVTAASHGTVQISNNKVVYTPTSGYTGIDSFEYTITDSVSDSIKATVTVTISSATTGGGSTGGDLPPAIIPPTTIIDTTVPAGTLTEELMDEETPLGLIAFFDPYIKGYPDGNFKAKRAISRVEMAAIFARILKLDLTQSKDPIYKDVKASHWGYKYLQAVSEIGLFKGYIDGTFRPDQAMTRAEITAVIAKYWDYVGFEANDTETKLTDIKGHWAIQSINKLFNENLISGFPDATFRPNSTLIREQVVVVINNLINRPTYENETNTFDDIFNEYWAYGDIEAASAYFQLGEFASEPKK